MKVSVICVYNREEQLQSQLAASLKEQDLPHELIALDSREHGFTSAARGLNEGARRASGDILVFAHQDIVFKTAGGLRELAEEISRHETGEIFGVVGVREKDKTYYSNLTSGSARVEEVHRLAPGCWPADCVDECLFGMRKDTWEGHPFDETLCDNWHLYAVEQCLHARKQGHGVWVVPVQAHHFSWGRITGAYMDGLKRLCAAYRKDFRYIWTTCYKVRTNPVWIGALTAAWKLNRRIRGNRE